MIAVAQLQGAASTLERMLCCDELPRGVQEHLSFALAHMREARVEAERGAGRSAARLQDDLWEERRRLAEAGLRHAWQVAGWPMEQSGKGVLS